MVDEQLRLRGIHDEAVLAAMGTIPRHLFVPESRRDQAYEDRALPTAEGQTISQPYIVARMTELLRVEAGHRVLEIGTGSGYQAAILVHLGARVWSIESRPSLAEAARRKLESLTLSDRIEVLAGDGTVGHAEQAPYDRIMVTAAAPHVPQALRDQLCDVGRMVIPLGDRERQNLNVLDRRGSTWSQHRHLPCRFVPLVGRDAWA